MLDQQTEPGSGWCTINIHTVFFPLVGLSLLICLIDVGSAWWLRSTMEAPAWIGTLQALFAVGEEANVPTWFSALLWAGLATTAAVISRLTTGRRYYWLLLAVIASLAAVDEIAQLHEKLHVVGDLLAVQWSIRIGFTWVFPGAMLAVCVAIMMARWVMSLPAGPRWGLLAAALLFVAGALGMEVLSGLRLVDHGFDATADNYVILEELLEMSAVSLAVASLLSLLEYNRQQPNLRLRLRQISTLEKNGSVLV